MSFRNIRPSSTNNQLQLSTSESTSSADAAKKSTPNESSSSGASKRRRVPESVTRNACVNCKKARAKCDGKKPCTRCVSRMENSPCLYEIHVKHAKEELVKQIRDLKTKDQLTQQIFRALSSDQHIPEILHRLRNGETYESIAEWLGPLDGDEIHSPTGSLQSSYEMSDHEMTGVSSNFRWTTVTSDLGTLDHLFQLYFAWIHPVHTLFHEGHFVKSFRNKSQLYCSPVLINAMCALACHLHTNAESDEIEQLGLAFSDAVRANINPQDHSLTTVQAFAVMFLVDCARGQALRAASYLKVASCLLSNIEIFDHDGYGEVFWNTRRGIHCLNVEWAQLTFQLPTFLKPRLEQTIEDNNDEQDEAKWYFYRDVNDQCPAWSGLMATTSREKAKLLEIIEDVATLLYNPAGAPIQAHQILQHYARYLQWRERLPDSICDTENNALPHVISLLILYSTSVVQLLRPLLEFEGLQSAGIDEVIWQNAQTGVFLYDERYRAHFRCRHQPVLQMFSLLHLCDVIVRFYPGKVDSASMDGPEVVQFGMEVLSQSSAGFPIAATLLELLRRTAIDCSVPLPKPKNIAEPNGPFRAPKSTYRADDFIDACTRPSYVQPIADIQATFDSNFSADWNSQSPSRGFKDPGVGARRLRRSDTEERAAQNLMQISSLLNTT